MLNNVQLGASVKPVHNSESVLINDLTVLLITLIVLFPLAVPCNLSLSASTCVHTPLLAYTHYAHTCRRMVVPNATVTFPGMSRLRESQIMYSLSRCVGGGGGGVLSWRM